MANIEDILKTKEIFKRPEREVFQVEYLPIEKLYSNKGQFYSEPEIEEFAAFIQLSGGVKQNLLVRRTEPGRYEVIAGHRRWMASKYLVEQKGLEKYRFIPCKIEHIDNLQAEFDLITTNCTQRERSDYEKMKEVERLREIIPKLPGNEEMKGRALRAVIAKVTGQSQTKVGQLENISRNLSDQGKEQLAKGTLPVSVANELAGVPEEDQKRVLQAEKVTLQDVKQIKQELSKEKAGGPEPEKNPEFTKISELQKSAEKQKTQNPKILFMDAAHKQFFKEALQKCRYLDGYHQALIYCLGLSEDTRQNVDRIYDFKTGSVKPKCLQESWQTSGSKRIIRLAFNLYTDGTPTTDADGKTEEQIREIKAYSVSDLFCTSDAIYFWEAIKLRYPQYIG